MKSRFHQELDVSLEHIMIPYLMKSTLQEVFAQVSDDLSSK